MWGARVRGVGKGVGEEVGEKVWGSGPEAQHRRAEGRVRETALKHIAFNQTSLAVRLNNASECAFECAGVADAGVVYWGQASPEVVKVRTPPWLQQCGNSVNLARPRYRDYVNIRPHLALLRSA